MVFLQVAENHLVAAEDDQDTTASLAKLRISANLTVAMATDFSKSFWFTRVSLHSHTAEKPYRGRGT